MEQFVVVLIIQICTVTEPDSILVWVTWYRN